MEDVTGAEGTDTDSGDAEVSESDVEAGLPDFDQITAETLAENESTDEVADDDVVADDQPSYRVKVDGEEIEVTLEELLGGYQRTSDYTRKTQALAQERERFAAFEALERAFTDDPVSTLQALARAYEVDLATGNPADEAVDVESMDPLEREVHELREWRASVEAEREQRASAERLAAVDAEVEAIRTKYGAPELDQTELLQFAVDNKIGTLEMAFVAMRAVKGEAEKSAAAERANEANKRKRTTPPVEGGSARTPKAVVRGSSSMPSIEEAWAEALSDLG